VSVVKVSEIVKVKLEKYKEDEGCKTLSDAINLLIYKAKHYADKYPENGF